MSLPIFDEQYIRYYDKLSPCQRLEYMRRKRTLVAAIDSNPHRNEDLAELDAIIERLEGG